MRQLTTILICLLVSSCVDSKQRLIDKADAYYNKGVYYTTSGNDDLAMIYYDSALMYNERIEYYGMRGATKNDYGDYDGAISDFQKGIALDSISSSALLVMKTLIDAYMNKSDYEKVIYYAEKMNQIKPFSISFSDIGGL